MKDMFRSLRNRVDYPLRELFKWQRPVAGVRSQTKAGLYAHLQGVERKQAEDLAEHLKDAYHLQAFYDASTADNYRENLYYLHLIESALNAAGTKLPEDMETADIGVSHWFYVQALYAALTWWRSKESRSINIWGYEVDAYRVYTDLHSRYDHALSNMRELENLHYLPSAFERQPLRFELITMFFPFVFTTDHLEWGLPGSLFDPAALLNDAWESLTPGGVLIVVNQGSAEHEAQRHMCLQSGIPIQQAFEFKSLLNQYPHPHYVHVSVKSTGR